MMAMTQSNSTNVNAPALLLDRLEFMLKKELASAMPWWFQLKVVHVNSPSAWISRNPA
jgi:hypothetical protein